MAKEIEIVYGLAPTPIRGRGRPRGTGLNQRLFDKIKPSDTSSCLFGVSEKKMRSLKTSAQLMGIEIKIRRLENNKYAIWRTT